MDDAFDYALSEDEMGDAITINDVSGLGVVSPIEIEDGNRFGGRVQLRQTEVFISRDFWEEAQGKKGSLVSLPNGDSVKIVRVIDHGGKKLALVCEQLGSATLPGAA